MGILWSPIRFQFYRLGFRVKFDAFRTNPILRPGGLYRRHNPRSVSSSPENSPPTDVLLPYLYG